MSMKDDVPSVVPRREKGDERVKEEGGVRRFWVAAIIANAKGMRAT
jgi:hypothetical protein